MAHQSGTHEEPKENRCGLQLVPSSLIDLPGWRKRRPPRAQRAGSYVVSHEWTRQPENTQTNRLGHSAPCSRPLRIHGRCSDSRMEKKVVIVALWCESVRGEEDVYLMVDVIHSEDSSVLKRKKHFQNRAEGKTESVFC